MVYQALFKQFGVLLTCKQLAQVLHRSKDGLRQTLKRRTEWTARVNSSKVRFGRRVYFRTGQIAELIGGSASDE